MLSCYLFQRMILLLNYYIFLTGAQLSGWRVLSYAKSVGLYMASMQSRTSLYTRLVKKYDECVFNRWRRMIVVTMPI